MPTLSLRHTLAALSAAALAIGSLATATPSAADDLVKASLRLKWLPQAQFAGFYVGVAKGYYKAEGIDLTINPGGPNILGENLVATGADTFAQSGGTDSVFAARDKGLPIVCVGVAHQITPFIFVARKDGPVKTIQDFKGKTVTTWFTGANHVLTGMLTKEGVKPEDVNIQPQQVSVTPFVDGNGTTRRPPEHKGAARSGGGADRAQCALAQEPYSLRTTEPTVFRPSRSRWACAASCRG